MRVYGKINSAIWNSQKFSKLDDASRLLYLYLHTCPHGNSIGCFVLKNGYALADLEWDLEAYDRAIDILCSADLIGIDRNENLIRLVNFLSHDPLSNPKHAKGALKIAMALPNSEQKLLILKDMAESNHLQGDTDLDIAIKGVSIPYRNQNPNPNPNSSLQGASAEKEKIELDKNVNEETVTLMLNALGVTDENKTHGLLVWTEIFRWFENGCDLEKDILPVLRAKAAQGHKATNWAYFTKAIFQAKANRTAPPPTVEAKPTFQPFEDAVDRRRRKLKEKQQQEAGNVH